MAFSPDQRAAVRFFAKTLLLALPLLLPALAVEGLLWRVGENWSIARVIDAQQQSGESVFGRSLFSQQFNLYKRENLRRRKPAVVALGSSRVMQLRQFMFAPATFYNAGGLFQNSNDLGVYVDLVASKSLPLPDVAIIGLDPWWFSQGRSGNSWLRADQEHSVDAVFSFVNHVSALQRLVWHPGTLYFMMSTRKTAQSPGEGSRAYGLAAMRGGGGERGSDGSHFYSQYLSEYARDGVYRDRESPPVVERVRKGLGPFDAVGDLDGARVDEAVASLRRLRELGAEVLVFLPPFSDETWNALEQSASLKSWWTRYSVELPKRLRTEGFAVVGPTHPSAVNLDDRVMFDGFHPGERMVVELLRLLREESKLLKARVDSGVLESLRTVEPKRFLSYGLPTPEAAVARTR